MARSLAALEERQSLANDLHDSVSQTLWTATPAGRDSVPGVRSQRRAARPGRQAPRPDRRSPVGDAHPAAGVAPLGHRGDSVRGPGPPAGVRLREPAPSQVRGSPRPRGGAAADRQGGALSHTAGVAQQRLPARRRRERAHLRRGDGRRSRDAGARRRRGLRDGIGLGALRAAHHGRAGRRNRGVTARRQLPGGGDDRVGGGPPK